jgi:hypothetical protein
MNQSWGFPYSWEIPNSWRSGRIINVSGIYEKLIQIYLQRSKAMKLPYEWGK